MALHNIKYQACSTLKQTAVRNSSCRQALCNNDLLGCMLVARTMTWNSANSQGGNLFHKFYQILISRGQTCKKSVSLQAARNLKNRLNEHLNILSQQFAKQCYGIVSQRIRRGAQAVKWYGDLGYDKKYLVDILNRIGRSLAQPKRSFGLLAAVAFSWKDEQITEEEVLQIESEIGYVHRSEQNKTAHLEKHFEKDWEKVIDRPKLLAWRKPVPGSSFYEYKLYGTVDDLPARAFYNAQIDIDYRKRWDKLVIKLDVIDRDQKSNSEVVHWVSHFPYPMYPREYVYIRKFKVDHKNNLLYTMARSCSHPAVPAGDKYVRVETYISHMVIRPHSTFNEDGFDYILTYYDEPKSNFPTFAYNWIASSGVPDFVDKMYNAARYLHKHGKNYQEENNRESQGKVAL